MQATVFRIPCKNKDTNMQALLEYCRKFPNCEAKSSLLLESFVLNQPMLLYPRCLSRYDADFVKFNGKDALNIVT